jgi:hypothetical protein
MLCLCLCVANILSDHLFCFNLSLSFPFSWFFYCFHVYLTVSYSTRLKRSRRCLTLCLSPVSSIFLSGFFIIFFSVEISFFLFSYSDPPHQIFPFFYRLSLPVEIFFRPLPGWTRKSHFLLRLKKSKKVFALSAKKENTNSIIVVCKLTF